MVRKRFVGRRSKIANLKNNGNINFDIHLNGDYSGSILSRDCSCIIFVTYATFSLKIQAEALRYLVFVCSRYNTGQKERYRLDTRSKGYVREEVICG